MKFALCVGHSRSIHGQPDGGAVSWDGHENEWTFNNDLALLVADKLSARGLESFILNRYDGDSYPAAMAWMAKQIDAAGCNAGIELHFNDAEPPAHGHEVLCCQGSVKGKIFGAFIDQRTNANFGNADRGVHELGPDDRGYAAVHDPAAVMLIYEPGFGSNREDWAMMTSRADDIAESIAEGCQDYAMNA